MIDSQVLQLAQAIDEAVARGIKIDERGPYERFQDKYFDDPAGFMRDCIDWSRSKTNGLYDYQSEIVGAVVDNDRISVRGPHGLGKTAIMALLLLWFALTRDGQDWKIPTTASVWRQVVKFLWGEVHKWARLLRWEVIGRELFKEGKELKQHTLTLRTGEAFAMSSRDESSLEGAHADHIMVIFDESKVIPVAIWDAIEGVFSTETDDKIWLAFSTPGDTSGRYYEIHTRKPGTEDWWVRHVTLSETIETGAVSATWAEQRAKLWGEDSTVYRNRVLGEFGVNSDSVVVPLPWIEAAMERWVAWKEGGKVIEDALTSVGVDVARYGQDKSVLAPRHGTIITSLIKMRKRSTMYVAGKVIQVMNKTAVAVVDVIGIGAGVVDKVRDEGYRVIGFNAGAATKRTDASGELTFVNCRSAAWWNIRELLDPANGNDVMLPFDDELTGDLAAPTWDIIGSGKIRVESKDQIRERIGRSTDCADAVIQAFYIDKSDWLAFLAMNQEERDDFVNKWA